MRLLPVRLALLLFLVFASFGAFVPLYPLHLREALGFGDMAIAYCSATQSVAMVVASLVVGQIADRWLAAQRCLALGALLAGLLLWVLAHLTSPWAVFLTTLGCWLVGGPTMFLGTTICFSHLERPEKQFGPIRLWGTVGWMVPGWILYLWLRQTNPHAQLSDIYRLAAFLAWALALYALTLPHTPPSTSPASRTPAPLEALARLRSRSFFTYCSCTVGFWMTMAFTAQNIPLLLEQLGLPRNQVALSLTLEQVSEVVGLALLPFALLVLGTRGTMLIGLSAWTAFMTVLSIGRPLGLVIPFLTCHGVCISGFIIAGQVFVNQQTRADLRASTQSLLTFTNALGMLGGHLLAGWLRHLTAGDLPRTFTAAAVVMAGLLALFLVGFRPGEPAPIGDPALSQPVTP
jgi:predicted MFS family arabinose efflux permease